MSMRVAVTGATGIVGRFVVARLQAEGVAIRALVRASSDRGGLPAEIRYVVGEMADADSLTALVDGVDAVVHCAYAHVPGRYRGGEAEDRFAFWRTNLLAGVELMERARLAGVKRLVLLSSRAVFGRDTPAADWVDDETRPVPDTHYGALKLALEAHASAFSSADGVCYASLRPTGVYGITQPVESSKWFDLARSIVNGAALPPARRATEVHGADVASAVWTMLTSPAETVGGEGVQLQRSDGGHSRRHGTTCSGVGRAGRVARTGTEPRTAPDAVHRASSTLVATGGRGTAGTDDRRVGRDRAQHLKGGGRR